MSKLYGVDVFSGEGKNILDNIDYDFAIVKVSGNPQDYAWNYVNPYAAEQAKDCMKKTGLLGLYHFTWGKENPNVEADFFINEVKKLGYLGKAMLVIDYEAQATRRGRTWVGKFADRIAGKTGQTPIIYASSSVIKEQKLDKLGYPLWCANYYKGYDKIYGYNTSGCKIGFADSLIWQFTSSGRLKGYGGNLDLNVFYGTADNFRKYMRANDGKGETPSPKPKKSIETLAREVIAGKWSTGAGRRQKLTSAGYDYDAVQRRVNEIIAQTTKKKSNEQIAREVIAGKWGNGETRKKKLKAAGYSCKAVQKIVNKLVEK